MTDPASQLTDGVVRVGTGAGFVVTADGLIVTCAHVVPDGDSVTVTFKATGAERQARIEPAYW
ncbi:MAG: trypsin-like peptidase domain-containing protein, partial [Egibacteraceae bacterium]